MIKLSFDGDIAIKAVQSNLCMYSFFMIIHMQFYSYLCRFIAI